MASEMMPVGRDFYLSRTPHGASRATVTHHRVIDPQRFLDSQCAAAVSEVKSGRKELIDELHVATEAEYREANGLKAIVRSGA